MFLLGDTKALFLVLDGFSRPGAASPGAFCLAD